MSNRRLAVSVNVAVGGMIFTPDQLRTLGSIANDGSRIEMTPFKQLYVSVDESRVDEAQRVLIEAGLRVLPAGFFTKNLQACNFCKDAEEAGLELAAQLDEAIAGLEVPTPIKIGYAGCALGTSEPLSKDISVVKMRNLFDIYIGGDVKGIRPVFAELFAKGLEKNQVIPLVMGIIDLYKTNAKGKENFRKFMNRMTLAKIKECVGF